MACIEHIEKNGVIKNGHEDHWCTTCKNSKKLTVSCKLCIESNECCFEAVDVAGPALDKIFIYESDLIIQATDEDNLLIKEKPISTLEDVMKEM